MNKITVQYPEEKTPQSPRFRGLHALRRYANGEERLYCLASCVKQFVLPSRLLSNPNSATTVRAVLHATILI